MKAENIQDLINYEMRLKVKINEELRRYLELNKKVFSLSVSKERELLYERIERHYNKLRELRALYKEGATFKTPEFVQFLVNYLNITKGEFVETELSMEKEKDLLEPIVEKFFKKYSKNYMNIKAKKYYFISDVATQEFIKSYTAGKGTLSRITGKKRPKDVLFFDTYYTYPFDGNLRLKEQFSDYPELAEVFYELILLKLNKPELTDEERLNTVLVNQLARDLNKNQSHIKQKSSNN